MPPARVAIWVASFGGVALCVRSLVFGPIPLTIALLAFFAYAALMITGVLVPQLEMYGDVVSRGDPTTQGVALTFDDGPHPVTTPKILEVLAQAGVKATFFVVGSKVERYPEVVRAIVEAGHTLGLHGYVHDRLYALLPPNAVLEDIRRTQAVVEAVAGIGSRWFRPPVGQVSPRTAEGARRAGVEIVAWSVRGLDGVAGSTPEQVASRIARGLRAGAIVLMHDASEREDFAPASIDALPRVLAAVREKALRVVPLDELLREDDAA